LASQGIKTSIKKDDPGCFQSLREELQNKGVPEGAVSLILSSWREGTKKQYTTYLNKWLQFCSEREIDSFNPSVTNVLLFLTALHNGGLGYSGINTAKSAISSVVNIVNNVHIGNHIMIKQFLKGVFNEKPALPRYNCTWDVNIVLSYISSLDDHEDCASNKLKFLSFKLIMLLALTTGQRLQTLFYIDIRNIDICEQYVKIRCGDLLKTSKVGSQLPELYIEAYARNPNLCVVKTLCCYLKETKVLRGTETQLFVSYQKPHKKVTKSTLGKWIKTVLSNAGINIQIFKPHSTRSASTSAASFRVPIETVLKTAGWKQDCTFRQFYKREISNDTSF
jgi:site-specific recombinase XerD